MYTRKYMVNENNKNIKEESELASLLTFIENNTSKENFIAWLNTQQDRTFSEEDTWEHLKTELSGEDGVALSELKTYAKSLGEEQDVEHLLRTVKETTQEAEKTAERLNYLTTFKKFSVAIGGATIFSGILLFTVAGLLFFGVIGTILQENVEQLVVNFMIIVGLLNILAGILLATR